MLLAQIGCSSDTRSNSQQLTSADIVFQEIHPLNNGTIENQTYTLEKWVWNENFSYPYVLEQGTHYTIDSTNIPDGLNFEIELINKRDALLTFYGKAQNHHVNDSTDGILIKFLPEVFLNESPNALKTEQTILNAGIQFGVGYTVSGTLDISQDTIELREMTTNELIEIDPGKTEFKFSKMLEEGEYYLIQIEKHPEGKVCQFDIAEGSIENTNIQDLQLSCHTPSWKQKTALDNIDYIGSMAAGGPWGNFDNLDSNDYSVESAPESIHTSFNKYGDFMVSWHDIVPSQNAFNFEPNGFGRNTIRNKTFHSNTNSFGQSTEVGTYLANPNFYPLDSIMGISQISENKDILYLARQKQTPTSVFYTYQTTSKNKVWDLPTLGTDFLSNANPSYGEGRQDLSMNKTGNYLSAWIDQSTSLIHLRSSIDKEIVSAQFNETSPINFIKVCFSNNNNGLVIYSTIEDEIKLVLFENNSFSDSITLKNSDLSLGKVDADMNIHGDSYIAYYTSNESVPKIYQFMRSNGQWIIEDYELNGYNISSDFFVHMLDTGKRHINWLKKSSNNHYSKTFSGTTETNSNSISLATSGITHHYQYIIDNNENYILFHGSFENDSNPSTYKSTIFNNEGIINNFTLENTVSNYFPGYDPYNAVLKVNNLGEITVLFSLYQNDESILLYLIEKNSEDIWTTPNSIFDTVTDINLGTKNIYSGYFNIIVDQFSSKKALVWREAFNYPNDIFGPRVHYVKFFN
jgi:hypothetical protein